MHGFPSSLKKHYSAIISIIYLLIYSIDIILYNIFIYTKYTTTDYTTTVLLRFHGFQSSVRRLLPLASAHIIDHQPRSCGPNWCRRKWMLSWTFKGIRDPSSETFMKNRMSDKHTAKLTWLAGIFSCFNWKYIFNWSILEPSYVRLIVGLCVFCSITVLFLNVLTIHNFLTSNDSLWSCILWVN